MGLPTSYRTHNCGCLRLSDVGKKVKLAGWARLIRDHGGVKFIDLCDREGCTQVVFDPAFFKNMETAEKIGREYVIQVEGKVRKRPAGTEDKGNPTGDIEVVVEKLKILNTSKTPPFELIEEKKRFLPNEEIRLKWRYLDLRRREMIKRIKIRHEVVKTIRDFLLSKGFWELETPCLVRSTPEGARDFLVPSRLHPGKFYALPQSPQLYKQLIMISSLDRYFQVARCFRDEDIREDRQPEFTQIDIEMSFVTAKEVMELVEGLIKKVWSDILGVKDVKFRRLTYDESMKLYGTDKPDLRYGLEIVDVSEIVKSCGYKIFNSVIKKGGKVKCINASGAYKICKKGKRVFNPKSVAKLIAYVNSIGGKGLTWIIVEDKRLSSIPPTIAESLGKDVQRNLIKRMEAKEGDILFFVADEEKKALAVCGEVRKKVAEMMGLVKDNKWSFVWVVDPPYFEHVEEGFELKPSHHPFTMPKKGSVEYLKQDLEKIKADAYDLVINGVEVGGGSIRMHSADMQREILKLMGYSKKEMEEKFGFLIKALEYGAPPHGGIAFGLDRLVAIITNSKSIRDVIIFPKTKNFVSLVDDAPKKVDEKQLKELNIIALSADEEE
ncbi:MAG TPA: aspartate--tRNA ligase [Candidatus Aenigmarchaeota archaeon]|nr:aspartate--tRNA ligase [Candidatus Aenigmarchaeota archaeon]